MSEGRTLYPGDKGYLEAAEEILGPPLPPEEQARRRANARTFLASVEGRRLFRSMTPEEFAAEMKIDRGPEIRRALARGMAEAFVAKNPCSGDSIDRLAARFLADLEAAADPPETDVPIPLGP